MVPHCGDLYKHLAGATQRGRRPSDCSALNGDLRHQRIRLNIKPYRLTDTQELRGAQDDELRALGLKLTPTSLEQNDKST